MFDRFLVPLSIIATLGRHLVNSTASLAPVEAPEGTDALATRSLSVAIRLQEWDFLGNLGFQSL